MRRPRALSFGLATLLPAVAAQPNIGGSFDGSSDDRLCSPQEFFPGTWVSADLESRAWWPCCGWDAKHFLHDEMKCGTSKMPRPGNCYTGGAEYYAHMGGYGCTCMDGGEMLWAADWQPHTCSLLPWDARSFCRILGNRTMLVVGDSTMEQTATTLMNAAHGVCGTQISYAPADTLVGQALGYFDRGRWWFEWVPKYRPDILLLSDGANIDYNLNFQRVLEMVNTEYNEKFDDRKTKYFGEKPLLIWKTQNPGGCNPNPVAEHPTFRDYKGYGGPVNEELWASFWERDLWAIQFWKSKGVPVLDVRALYMRMDAHPGSRSPRGGSEECLAFCGESEGPLHLIPQLLHHLLFWMQEEDIKSRRTK